MLALDEKDYVTYTPEGYYNASKNGAKYIRFTIGLKSYSVEQFARRFYRPGMVSLTLQSKPLSQAENLEDILVSITAPGVCIQ